MDRYVITSEEIDEFAGTHKVHFLNPNAVRRNKSLGDLTGLSAIGFHIIEIEPGRESTEPHTHHFEEECVFILEGEAEATIGAETIRVKAGDFIGYRRGGEAHQLRNTGRTLLRCIVVGQRLDHDVADYPRLRKRIFRNRGLEWNLVDIDAIEKPVAGAK